MDEITVRRERRQWTPLSLEERATLAEQYGADELFYCKDSWSLRHYWMHKESGEYQRARCNRWECSYCGPLKVNLWRELVKIAEPTLFLTLTKAGKTVAEARRAFTTFIQALRRGSKGRGPNRKGAREAYPIAYFAVLERHKDFERNGFHWHVLIKGVESIPYKEVIQPLWMSATHYQPATEDEESRGAMIGHIERVRNNRAIGYVTKYLMKALSTEERGKKEVKREQEVLVREQNGFRVEKEIVVDQVTSKAHRICYSRQFFPERVEDLRKRLFAGVEHEVVGIEENGKPLEEEEEEKGSQWVLMEREIEQVDMDVYKQQRYAEVAEDLEELRECDPERYQELDRAAVVRIGEEARMAVRGVYKQLERKILLEAMNEERRLSRRVISMWHYHRYTLRLAV